MFILNNFHIVQSEFIQFNCWTKKKLNTQLHNTHTQAHGLNLQKKYTIWRALHLMKYKTNINAAKKEFVQRLYGIVWKLSHNQFHSGHKLFLKSDFKLLCVLQRLYEIFFKMIINASGSKWFSKINFYGRYEIDFETPEVECSFPKIPYSRCKTQRLKVIFQK